MGMFDSIRCNYPLPGTPPSFIQEGHLFQTKDLDCVLDTYTIHKDGSFDYDPPFTGEITFYDCNIAASGPGIYTENGEDAENVEYKVKFVDGVLQEINEAHRSRRPALPYSSFDKYTKGKYEPKEKSGPSWKERTEALHVGQKVYVLYGGTDPEKGYEAEIVATLETQLCLKGVQYSREKLWLMDRRHLDRILFENKESAMAIRNQSRSAWEKEKQEYDDYAAEWHKKNQESP